MLALSVALFYAFAALTVLCAGGVAFSRNIVYSAFALLGTLFGVAALYVCLAADFVAGSGPQIGATITPQHLVINRNAIFDGGIRPHAYCLPVAKRERHRLAVRKAAVSGSPKFFLGTDSAPHERRAKESSCGCAGIFNAPLALESYASVF